MSVRNLDGLFQPRSVALIGASNRSGSVGQVVMRNLLQGGFDGPIMPVNPRQEAVAGVLAYADVASLPVTPDLAVIATPPPTVPGLIADLAARGTRAAVVLTAGLGRADAPGDSLAKQALEAARPACLRLLGPNCVGLLVPGTGLNASFAHTQALPGSLALVSQSGAMCTAILDWAGSRGIGFSHFISIGDGLDVDFADALDHLGGDPAVSAILLYVESISRGRKFMSAARAAARNKPVLVIKSGRSKEGAKAAASHTGALAGDDAVYDAAFRRAGLLRVATTDEIFNAVETLARSRPLLGDRLAILTNGGGPGVMGADALAAGGGRLAELSAATLAALDAVLPATWSKGNPVDIIGDGGATRYRDALRLLLAAEEVDSVLVLHVPTAIVDRTMVAEAVIEEAGKSNKHLLTSWLGDDGVAAARRCFAAAGLPTYTTPEEAVEAFLHSVAHGRNQALLREAPPSEPETDDDTREGARTLIEGALAEGRTLLTEAESKELLAAYGIPVVPTHIARTPEEVADLAAQIQGPVAVKILSKEISHKSDVGGVALDLGTPDEAAAAARTMIARVAVRRPDATLEGFTVQPMVEAPAMRELIVGITTDAVFGPVILFGQGGTAVELIRDRAISLPPLNRALARDLVSRTRVARLLDGYRRLPAIDHEALLAALIRVAQIAIDLPEVKAMDVNPLRAGPEGVVALDARFEIGPPAPAPRLAIRPYPRNLEEEVRLDDGLEVHLRPVRPEDGPAYREFLASLGDGDVRFRTFDLVRPFPLSESPRLCQIDYDRELGLVAVTRDEASPILGILRAAFEPDGSAVQFALSVRGDHRGRGLGPCLLAKLVRVAHGSGAPAIVGVADARNEGALQMARAQGFRATPRPDGLVTLRHELGADDPSETGGPRRPTVF